MKPWTSLYQQEPTNGKAVELHRHVRKLRKLLAEARDLLTLSQGEPMATRRDTMTTKAERRTAAAQRSAPTLRTINDDDVAVLGTLSSFRAIRGARGAWLTTRQVGGESHSQHANILVKLERHGLVERKVSDTGKRILSRITTKGQRVLAAVEAVE